MRRVWEVFWQFLLLGLTSFGGPAAHLGYFQKNFVQDKKWIDQDGFSRLVALSQFLPGPGSSQVGFALGLQRAGLKGGLAAFIGFTLPSFFIIYVIATTTLYNEEQAWLTGLIHGLKLLAVIVVADATLNMMRSFCKETTTMAIAVLTAATLLVLPSLWTQLCVLIMAAIYGAFKQYRAVQKSTPITASTSKASDPYITKLPFFLFVGLFFLLPVLGLASDWIELISSFYHAGSLVFGGGHVVLPLLQQTLAESIDNERFLLGYAAAQAIPGPMFTLATFLGADLMPENSLLGAIVATLAIFLPGFLLILSIHGSWERLTTQPKVAGAIWGINASVVGLLLSALYQPVFISAVGSAIDMALVICGFFVMRYFKIPILVLVIVFSILGIISNLL